MLLRAALCAVLIGTTSAGCSTRDDSPPPTTDGGGPPAEIALTVLRDYSTEVPLADGDDVNMLFPPQGGRVIFVGFRARGFKGCPLQLTGAIRDPHTKQVRIDARTVTLHDAGDGFGTPGGIAAGGTADISAYANIPVCPNQWASADLFDQPFVLEANVQDCDGKTASKTIHVTPRCVDSQGSPATDCRCICAHGYVLGQQCAFDASDQ